MLFSLAMQELNASSKCKTYGKLGNPRLKVLRRPSAAAKREPPLPRENVSILDRFDRGRGLG